MPYDPTGAIWGDLEEKIVSYPQGLTLHIDGVEFATLGYAQEEKFPGDYSVRRWIAVAPTHTNGIRHSPRLVDERGISGLRERANRERLHTQAQEQD